jgi:hypothetical protein
MSVHVAFEADILVTTFTGLVTTDDLFVLAQRVAAIEDGGSTARLRLTDLSLASGMHITFSDVMDLAGRRAVRELAAPIRSAIVAADPAHRGFARMYQTLMDHPEVTIEIFGDRESARAWLVGDTERASVGADAVAPRSESGRS